MSAEFGKSAVHPAHYARYANRRLVKWLDPFAQRLQSIWRCPFLRCSYRLGRTRHTCLSRLVSCFLSSLGRTQSTFKDPLFFKIFYYGGSDEVSLSHAALTLPHPTTYSPVDPEISSLSLSPFPPLFSSRLVRFGRSSCSYFFPSSSFFLSPTLFPPLQLLYYCPLFFAFASPYLGCRLLVIDAYVGTKIPLLSKPVSFRSGNVAHLHTPFAPLFIRFVRFRVHFSSSFVDCRFTSSNLDTRWISAGCVSSVPSSPADAGSTFLVDQFPRASIGLVDPVLTRRPSL